MRKLNDTQLVLLTTASQRNDGSLLPTPETLTTTPAQIRKALNGLIQMELVAEAPTRSLHAVWREDADERVGLIINDAGRAAIGLSEAPPPAGAAEVTEDKASAPSAVRSGSKQALLLELVQRETGASIGEIVDATGWLAHTARAAITGLRKRGHDIALEKGEGASRYRCQQAAS